MGVRGLFSESSYSGPMDVPQVRTATATTLGSVSLCRVLRVCVLGAAGGGRPGDGHSQQLRHGEDDVECQPRQSRTDGGVAGGVRLPV